MKNEIKFIEHQYYHQPMESSQILIAGVGGLGCSWAKGAWSKCDSEADILLIDADDESFSSIQQGHCPKPASNGEQCRESKALLQRAPLPPDKPPTWTT